MACDGLPEELGRRLRTLQLIWGGLLVGAVLFYIVAIYLRLEGRLPLLPEQPLLGYVAVLIGVLLLVLQYVIPRQLLAQARRRLAQQGGEPVTSTQLGGAWQTAQLVRMAIIEAGICAALVLFFLEPMNLSRYTALVMTFVLAGCRPTQEQAAQELAEQAELARRERD